MYNDWSTVIRRSIKARTIGAASDRLIKGSSVALEQGDYECLFAADLLLPDDLPEIEILSSGIDDTAAELVPLHGLVAHT